MSENDISKITSVLEKMYNICTTLKEVFEQKRKFYKELPAELFSFNYYFSKEIFICEEPNEKFINITFLTREEEKIKSNIISGSYKLWSIISEVQIGKVKRACLRTSNKSREIWINVEVEIEGEEYEFSFYFPFKLKSLYIFDESMKRLLIYFLNHELLEKMLLKLKEEMEKKGENTEFIDEIIFQLNSIGVIIREELKKY